MIINNSAKKAPVILNIIRVTCSINLTDKVWPCDRVYLFPEDYGSFYLLIFGNNQNIGFRVTSINII